MSIDTARKTIDEIQEIKWLIDEGSAHIKLTEAQTRLTALKEALAALPTIAPDAIRREVFDELLCAAKATLRATDRVSFAWKVGKCGPLSPKSCYVPDIARALDRLRAAILGAEPEKDDRPTS